MESMIIENPTKEQMDEIAGALRMVKLEPGEGVEILISEAQHE